MDRGYMDPVENLSTSINYIKRHNEEHMRLLHGDDTERVIAEMRAEQAAYRERNRVYREELTRFTATLGSKALNTPTTLAVYLLHAPDSDRSKLQCSQCWDGCDDYAQWPCDTIKAVAEALDVEVPTL